MKYIEKQDKRQRKSIRLKDYDYSRAGAYFVTVCAQGGINIFGNIADNQMMLNEVGRMVKNNWDGLLQRFPNVELDEFIMMPNHLHMIIIVGAGSPRPLNVGCACRNIGRADSIGRGNPAPTLGQIMAYFKYGTTKQINELRSAGIKKIWQRNYYEHVIRSDTELNRIRQYIMENPLKWESDPENPSVVNLSGQRAENLI